MSVRVAHIVPTDRVAYLMRARLMRLQEHDFSVSVVCGDRGYVELLRQCGLHVIPIPFAREISPWTDARCVWALRRVLREGQFDIMHSHNPKGTLLGPITAQWARTPLVVHTVHGFLFNENSRGLHRAAAVAAERWCAAWSDHLFFQSEADHAYAVEHRFKRPEQLHLIGNGVDERRYDPALYANARREKRRELGLGDDDLVVGMVTRLVREKGCIEFFAMAARVAKENPRARFLLVGIPEEKDQSDAVDALALARQYGVEARCILLEHRQDMPELYLSMDLCVLPSYREGLPRCILEAAAMGTAVAATDIRGCREVIKDGETGRLFPLKEVDGFSEVVVQLLADDAQRTRLAVAGKQQVQREYTEAQVTARLVSLYNTHRQ
jgi:glycosyltransferase involved in cell wall biosynthesis